MRKTRMFENIVRERQWVSMDIKGVSYAFTREFIKGMELLTHEQDGKTFYAHQEGKTLYYNIVSQHPGSTTEFLDRLERLGIKGNEQPSEEEQRQFWSQGATLAGSNRGTMNKRGSIFGSKKGE